MHEYCRLDQAEVVSNSRNKVHKTYMYSGMGELVHKQQPDLLLYLYRVTLVVANLG